jgi:hypothetical protein
LKTNRLVFEKKFSETIFSVGISCWEEFIAGNIRLRGIDAKMPLKLKNPTFQGKRAHTWGLKLRELHVIDSSLNLLLVCE